MLAYSLLLFVLTVAAFGLAYIVGASEISRPLRERWAETARPKDVFACHACMEDGASTFAWSRENCFICAGQPCCPKRGVAHNATFVLVQKAEDPFLLRLIECPACFGTWIGLMLGVIVAHSVESFSGWERIGVIILASLYICGTNYLLARATGLIPNPSRPTSIKE